MNLIGVGGRDPRSGKPYTYIETIGGGQGGRPYGPGMSAVHANMSNTLNTPIEALEITYPLRVERYELRDGSSGAGKNPGARAWSAPSAWSVTRPGFRCNPTAAASRPTGCMAAKAGPRG
ncbi:hypothetical protein MASR1M32_03020 [Rhodobacter sp.]